MGSTVSSGAETSKQNTWVSGKSPDGAGQGGSNRERGGRRTRTQEKKRGGRRNKRTQGFVIEGRRWPVDGRCDHWYIASYVESSSRRRISNSLRAQGSVKW